MFREGFLEKATARLLLEKSQPGAAPSELLTYAPLMSEESQLWEIHLPYQRVFVLMYLWGFNIKVVLFLF